MATVWSRVGNVVALSVAVGDLVNFSELLPQAEEEAKRKVVCFTHTGAAVRSVYMPGRSGFSEKRLLQQPLSPVPVCLS